MTFSELTGRVIGILKGTAKLAVCRDFELLSLSDAQDTLVTVGFDSIGTSEGYLASDGETLCRGCRVRLLITLLGREQSGPELLRLGEELLSRILSSELEVTDAQGGETAFNARLGRTQYPLLVTLSGEWRAGEFLCERRLRRAQVGGLAFLAQSVLFTRERSVVRNTLLGGSVLARDGGHRPLELTLRGAFSPGEENVTARLEAMALSGEAAEISLTGESLPPMRLRQYRFASEKPGEAGQCELVFWSGEDAYGG